MPEDKEQTPLSPTELGLRFGLPVAGLGEIANLGEAGAGAGSFPLAAGLGAYEGGVEAGNGPGGVMPGDSLLAEREGTPFEVGFQSVLPPAGLPLDDGLQAAPGQSGAEGLADLPRAHAEDPFDGP